MGILKIKGIKVAKKYKGTFKIDFKVAPVTAFLDDFLVLFTCNQYPINNFCPYVWLHASIQFN